MNIALPVKGKWVLAVIKIAEYNQIFQVVISES